MLYIIFPKHIYPPGFWWLSEESISVGRAGKSPANFCVQAADLVRVGSLPCRKTPWSSDFTLQTSWCLLVPPEGLLGAFGCLWIPSGCLWLPPWCLLDVSRCLHIHPQMPFRCISDVSQMPFRCLPGASQ